MSFFQGLGTFLGVGAVLTASCGIIWGLRGQQSPVTLNRLSAEDREDYGRQSIGKKYEYFLVNTQENPAWWAESYRLWSLDKDAKQRSYYFSKDNIEGISRADTGSETMGSVCQSVYRKKGNRVDFASEGEWLKLGRDLFKYCSVLRNSPKTMADEGADALSNVRLGVVKNRLVSLDSENDQFWSIKEEWFGANRDSDPNSHFSRNREVDGKAKTLKEMCGDVYGLSNANEFSAPEKEEVLRYCSFETFDGKGED